MAIHWPETTAAKAHWIAASEHKFLLAMTTLSDASTIKILTNMKKTSKNNLLIQYWCLRFMSLKRLCLSFFLVFIVPVGNAWAPKRSASPLNDTRYKKYRRQNPARKEWRQRDDRRWEDRYQKQEPRPWLNWRDEDRDAYHKRDRARDDRGDRRPRDRRPSEDRDRSYRSQRGEQRHHHTYPRQAPRGKDKDDRQGHRQDRPNTQRRDDRGYYAQRPPQAAGYDAPRSHKKTMSLNSLFTQIKGDLRRRDPRLEKNLDALCEASYQPDFNFISVSRAFSMLSRFAKNKPNHCDAIKAHRSFVPRMMQVAQQQIQDNRCDARGFANLLYGCMNLGITPDAAWQTTFWQHSQDELNDFEPQHFSNTLYAAAKLSLTPPKDWQQAFWTESQKTLNDFEPQHFSNTLYALAHLSLTPLEDWKHAFWRHSQDKLNDFEPQHFSNTLYAAAKLSLTPPEDWQKAFWTQSQSKLRQFNPQHFSNTLHAAAKLSLTPFKDWQQAFWTQSQSKLRQFNPQHFSNTLYAAAKLSLTLPEDWQQAFWTESQHQLRRFNSQGISNTLYAACVLDLTIPATVQSLVQPIVTSDTKEDIRCLQAMYNASDYLEAQGIHPVFNEDTPEKLRQRASTETSQLEKETRVALAKVLQDMCPQIPLKAQHFIGATASTADFFIESCGDQGLVIQVDGPSHFLDKCTERQRVNGFTAFQTRQLQDKGYQVLRLPYDVLKRHGVINIQNENSPVPPALAAYLKEQLTPYLTLAT